MTRGFHKRSRASKREGVYKPRLVHPFLRFKLSRPFFKCLIMTAKNGVLREGVVSFAQIYRKKTADDDPYVDPH